ncbi:MAG: AlpA family phage regulatory protein [Pseudomonadales bacterium]|nr:AlpA family phage regulatory protein [Pseudomonadales bacterium]
MKAGQIRYQRRPEVLARTGICNSSLCNRITEGQFPPPISLGGRAVGWLEHEVSAILAALAGGKSKDEIYQLVRSMVKERKNLAGGK